MATLLKIWLTLATLASSYAAWNFNNNYIGSGNDITIDGVSYTSGDANSPFYSTNNRQYWKDGKCVQEMTVSGNGVKDTFHNPCSNQGHSVLSKTDCLVIGEPNKDDFCLYTDSQAKLAVITGGKCTVRSYTTKDGKTTHTEQPLDQTGCDVVKAKMAEELEKNRLYWEDWNRKFEERMRKAFPPGFPFHNKNANSQSSSASSPSSSEEDDDSSQRPYANAFNGLSASPMSNSQPAVDSGVGSTKYDIKTRFPDTNDGQCLVEIAVAGNGISDTFTQQCSKDGADSINRDNKLIFGNPKINNLCLYSDAPNTLVVIKDKQCTRKIYKTKNGVTTSTKSPMTSAKCSEVKQKMSNALENREGSTPQKAADITSTPTVTYRPVDNRVNNPSFSTATNINFNNGQCMKELDIVGSGLNDRFIETCSSDVNPQKISTDNLLVMKGVSSDLDLYSEKWGSLVVIRSGKCSERKYETTNGQTKITSSPMIDADCNAVKSKITQELKKTSKHGQSWNMEHNRKMADKEKAYNKKMADKEKAYNKKMADKEKAYNQKMADKQKALNKKMADKEKAYNQKFANWQVNKKW